MALIVEDGTGLATAESYQSVQGHQDYCAARGYSVPATVLEIEQHARRATAYLTGVYRELWAGTRVNTVQALDWPRFNVPMRDFASTLAQDYYYPFDEVPVAVAQAQSEIMIRIAAGTDMSPDQTRGVLREKVGALEVEYDPNSSQSPSFPILNGMLKHLLTSTASPNGIRTGRIIRS